jgi:hypothetical protein
MVQVAMIKLGIVAAGGLLGAGALLGREIRRREGESSRELDAGDAAPQIGAGAAQPVDVARAAGKATAEVLPRRDRA